MKIAFVHGFILALGLILPLGVQNLFVLQQGMQQLRFRRTLPAVMTAASCDTLLIAGAVSGVSLLLLELQWLQGALLFLGFMQRKQIISNNIEFNSQNKIYKLHSISS